MPKRRTDGKLVSGAILVLVLLPLIALARPVRPSEARNERVPDVGLGAAEVTCPLESEARPTPEQVCSGCGTPGEQGEIHLADLRGEVVAGPYGKHLLVVYVVVHDGGHAPLGEVQVNASIWWPGGGPLHRTRMTKNANGAARFHWGSMTGGAWKLCVDSIVREGYRYDQGDSEASSCSEWSG